MHTRSRAASAQLLSGRIVGRRSTPELEGGDNLGNGKVMVLSLERDFTLLIGLRPEGSLVDLGLVVHHWSVSVRSAAARYAARRAG